MGVGKRITVGSATEYDNVTWAGYDAVIFEAADNEFTIGGFVAPDPVVDGTYLVIVNNSGQPLNMSILGDDISNNSDEGNRIASASGFDAAMPPNTDGATCILYYDATNSVWKPVGSSLQ